MSGNQLSPVHISIGSGKMENMTSINVSSLDNEFCQVMSKVPGSVCGKCYSNRYAKMRPSLEQALLRNTEILGSRLLEKCEVPAINARFVRFNSFGELINEIHYLNLIQIAMRNPYTSFGLWTKRADIVMKYPKEPNIRYIYSVPKTDGEIPREEYLDFFDKVFLVQSTDENQNCHGKCIDCLLCYEQNDTVIIRERIK
jgi:hypothetical protein